MSDLIPWPPLGHTHPDGFNCLTCMETLATLRASLAAAQEEVGRLNQEEFRRRTTGLSADPIRIALAERSDRWQSRALAAEARVEALEGALRGIGRVLPDGTMCWCGTAEVESYGHLPECDTARAALRGGKEG